MAKRKRNFCELLVSYACTYAWGAGDCVHRRPYDDGGGCKHERAMECTHRTARREARAAYVAWAARRAHNEEELCQGRIRV